VGVTFQAVQGYQHFFTRLFVAGGRPFLRPARLTEIAVGTSTAMASFQVTEVQKALKGADYPADGRALAELAKSNGADQELVDTLQGLGQVDGPDQVMKQLKGSLGGPTDGDG
jgi:hypothetical protein